MHAKPRVHSDVSCNVTFNSREIAWEMKSARLHHLYAISPFSASPFQRLWLGPFTDRQKEK